MAKTNTPTADKATRNGDVLRAPAEELYAEEIAALIQEDKYEKPPGWKMSARAVHTYICGGKAGKREITPKYIGHDRLVEIAIATLVTDRALLLIGEPGTAKSWLSEHLAAAINGDSTKVVQGTAGTTEEQIRYTWNYAMLIAQGPSPAALVKSPIFRAMESGTLARFEEITRCASEVQDALISLLSEKRMSVPELAHRGRRQEGVLGHRHGQHARPRRQRHVRRPQAALQHRRPAHAEDAGDGNRHRAQARHRAGRQPVAAGEGARRRGDREGRHHLPRAAHRARRSTARTSSRRPSGVLSTAEAISVLANSMALAGNFGSGEVTAHDLAAGLQGAVVKDEEKDRVVWQEYLTNVLKKRGADWRPLFTACSEHNE